LDDEATKQVKKKLEEMKSHDPGPRGWSGMGRHGQATPTAGMRKGKPERQPRWAMNDPDRGHASAAASEVDELAGPNHSTVIYCRRVAVIDIYQVAEPPSSFSSPNAPP